MILYGASGHCKVILDILHLNGRTVDFIMDDYPKEEILQNVPVQKEISNISPETEALISIGNNFIRKKIATKNVLHYITAIHPTAVISTTAVIGDGTVSMANVVVNAEAKIGKHVILNTSCVIEHDCIVEDFVHISPGALLAGNVSVGEGSQVGIGASVIQGVKIGKWCTIGAGAVIIRDVPDFSVVVGNPGRIIKTKEKSNFDI